MTVMVMVMVMIHRSIFNTRYMVTQCFCSAFFFNIFNIVKFHLDSKDFSSSLAQHTDFITTGRAVELNVAAAC